MVAATERVAETYQSTTDEPSRPTEQRSLRVLAELMLNGYFVVRLPWGQHLRTRGGAQLPRQSVWYRPIKATPLMMKRPTEPSIRGVCECWQS